MTIPILIIGLLALLAWSCGIGSLALCLYATMRFRNPWLAWTCVASFAISSLTFLGRGQPLVMLAALLASAVLGWWMRNRRSSPLVFATMGVFGIRFVSGLLLRYSVFFPRDISSVLLVAIFEAVLTTLALGLDRVLPRAFDPRAVENPEARQGTPQWRDALLGALLIHPLVAVLTFLYGAAFGAASPTFSAQGGSGPTEFGLQGGVTAIGNLVILSIFSFGILVVIITGVGIACGLVGFPSLREWRSSAARRTLDSQTSPETHPE